MVEDGECGLLYETGNVEALAELIIRLGFNRPERLQLGTRARQKVLDNFTFDRMAAEYRRHLGKTSAKKVLLH